MRIMLISPYAGIEDHVYREALILKAFKDSGHQIYYVTCNMAFNQFCMNHLVHELEFNSPVSQKLRSCNKCIKNSKLIQSSLVVDGQLQISQASLKDQKRYTAQLKEVNNSNWVNFEYENIKIGRIAFYEFALQHKINKLEIPDELFLQYKSHLSSVLQAYEYANEILSEVKPDAILVYNSRYSINNIFCKVADKLCVTHYTLNASGHWDKIYDRFTFFLSEDEAFSISKSTEWEYFKHIPLSLEEVLDVFKYLSSAIFPASNWHYSEKSQITNLIDLKKHFGIAQNQKTIIVTLSSEDELFALEESEILKLKVSYNSKLIFRNLEEWLFSIFKIAEKNKNLFFIIRPHPRDFPGRRGGQVKSDQAKFMEKFFSEVSIPSNCYVNYPNELVSIYDLMRIADLLLNQSSSVGVDFASFGVPIIHNNPKMLFSYPPDLGVSIIRNDDYEKVILETLDAPVKNNEKQILAFRWLYFKFFRIGFPIENSEFKFISRIKLYCLANKNSRSYFLFKLLSIYYKFARFISRTDNFHFVRCVEDGLKGTHSLAYLNHQKTYQLGNFGLFEENGYNIDGIYSAYFNGKLNRE